MKKRWIASILTVAMMISVISPLSAYADDGDDVLLEDDCGYEDPYDDGADEEGIHYYTEEDLSGSGDDMIATQASPNYTLDALRQKYPAGKYWNHAGSSTNNPEGYTSTACTDHYVKRADGTRGIGQYDNYYYGALGWATQCAGYAQKVASCYAGSDPQTWTKRTGTSAVNDLKTGDVVRYLNDGHSIFITAVDGENVWFSDCNYGNRCIIRWDVKTTKSEIKKTFTNVRVCPVDPGPDTCSTEYAGWYYVSADRTNIHSGHNLSSYKTYLIKDQRVYVTKATGAGIGQLGHIELNGQECYIEMAGLTRLSGVQTETTMYSGDQITGDITISGIACDWKDLSKAVQVRIVADSGQEATGTADRPGYNPLSHWSVATTAQKDQGENHKYSIQLNGLPSGMRTLHIYVCSLETGNWVEAETYQVSIATLEKLEIKTNPEKTEYIVGDTLNTSGLVLQGSYKYKFYNSDSGGTRDITSGFTCTPTTFDIAGTQTITVTYDGASTSFDVTVKEKEKPAEPTEPTTPTEPTEPDTPTTPTEPDQPTTPDTPDEKEDKLEFSMYPIKTKYTVGDTLDDSGMVLKWTHQGKEELVYYGYTCTPEILDKVGTQTITVSYKGLSVSYQVQVKAKDNTSSSGTTTKPSGDNTSTVKPGNNTSTTTPSDDGSGMAAAILLGGAVVVVGGIVMMAMAAMPVEVRATAISSDHAVLANVPITLLQGDRVVAQTVTDGNGQFNFNVKKGSYTLRMTTTNAETGETVTRYAYISAPASGSVVTF